MLGMGEGAISWQPGAPAGCCCQNPGSHRSCGFLWKWWEEGAGLLWEVSSLSVSGFDAMAREGFTGFLWSHPLSWTYQLFNLCESWGETDWERLNCSSPHHCKNAEWSVCSVLRYFLEEVTLHFMTSWLWSTSVQQSSSGVIQLSVDGLLSVLQFHKNRFTARLKRNHRGSVWSMATPNQVNWLLHQVEINYSLLVLRVVFLVSRRWVTYPGILCSLQARDCLKAVVKILFCLLSRHWKQSRNTPFFIQLFQTLALQDCCALMRY